MGYLSQASASVANSPKITISMWVNIPTATPGTTLLEFGHSYGGSSSASNAIFIANDGTFGNWIDVTLTSPQNALTEANIATYFSSSDEANDPDYQRTLNDPIHWTSSFDSSVRDLGSVIDAGVWFHLFVAADFTNDLVYGAGPYHTFFIFLNGVRQDMHAIEDGSGNLFGRIIDQATGQVQSAMFGNSAVHTDTNAIFSYAGQTGYLPATYTSGPFEYTRTVTVPVIGAEAITLTGSVPGWNLDINGTEIGIPAMAAHAASGVSGNSLSNVRVADVQIWVGQYIDPTTSIDKFISAGTAVNPSVAATAFGTPTFKFGGPASGIANVGSGGAFTATGSITDYTPGPT